MSTKTKKTTSGEGSSTIALNKKARHDYFIEESQEAGLVLEGWEVKSLRAGRAQIAEAYVVVRGGEVVGRGAHQGEQELHGARGLEAAMREVAVVAACDAEESDPEQPQAERDLERSDAGREREQAARVGDHPAGGGYRWVHG